MFAWGNPIWPHKKVREIWWRFKRATPYRKFEMIRFYTDKLLRIIGYTLLSNCDWDWRVVINFGCAIQFFLFAFYTTYYYWNDNIITAIQPCALIALIIPGVIICFQAAGPNKYRYRAIALFAGKNIYKDRTPTTEYEWKCDQLATKLLVHVILSVTLDLISYFLIIIGPAYVLIVKNEYVVPTGIIVPFMDPDSVLSFIINMSIQFSAAFVSLIVTIGFGVANCFIVNSYTGMAELVCLNMRTFSDGLRAGHFGLQQKLELRQIIVQLQDLERYIGELNDLMYWRTLTLPILTTWCVSLCIFSQMINGFPAGYGFAMTIYIQFLVLCFMGNEIKNTCDQIAAELYEIKWYLMPPQYRTMILTVLHRWQVGCNMTIGPFEELNYETASNTTKKIYSFFMLLKTNIAK